MKIGQNLGFGFIVIGGIVFVLRGFISTESPIEPFARDIFGFPLLDPSHDATLDVWFQFIIGALIPFVLIGIGLVFLKVSEPKKKELRELL